MSWEGLYLDDLKRNLRMSYKERDPSIAVSIRDVSKKYRLFESPIYRVFEALHPLNKKYHSEFWALKDISLDVPRGTTLGIIGLNGSGKSTLLQVIYGVLHPSSGSVAVNGRTAAILELGAGFNPELTGKVNVLLNGTMQGFNKREMNRRLPLIEEFADIGEYIDQPVKYYSSGMFVRLAFATAINVDPDILIIDEALAVGDAKFQNKCYSKFKEFQRAEKTIIFVTHDTNSIVKHCDTAILIDNGKIIEEGKPEQITDYYMDLFFTGKISGSQVTPLLVEESFSGFNIVHYKDKYYAVSQICGPVDFLTLQVSHLKKLIEKRDCFVGDSLKEVKLLIGKGLANDSLSNTSTAIENKTAFDRFLNDLSEGDKCPKRGSYNSNEYKSGGDDLEIIDYFLTRNDSFEAFQFEAGERINLYMKVLFREQVEYPNYGFLIKTKDGSPVYGLNTTMADIFVQSRKKGDVAVIKFAFNSDLVENDYFIDLGVSENLFGNENMLIKRSGIAHIVISNNGTVFTGMFNLHSRIQEL